VRWLVYIQNIDPNILAKTGSKAQLILGKPVCENKIKINFKQKTGN
jgi:hypothetical protein